VCRNGHTLASRRDERPRAAGGCRECKRLSDDRYEQTERARWMRDTYDSSGVRYFRGLRAAEARDEQRLADLHAEVGAELSGVIAAARLRIFGELPPLVEHDYLQILWRWRMTRAILDQRERRTADGCPPWAVAQMAIDGSTLARFPRVGSSGMSRLP
jgi:hypothetical protein